MTIHKNKTLFIFISTIIIFLFIPKLSFSNQTLEGFWEESTDSYMRRKDNNYLKIEFKKDKKCNIYIIRTDGTSLNFAGIYDLDTQKKPMPLSISSITNLNHPLHTIIRYIDENTIDIMQFSSTQRLRPVFFSEENKIRLKKIKLNN